MAVAYNGRGWVALPMQQFQDDPRIGPYEILVYAALLSFRNQKTGRCFPAHAMLAKRAKCSDRKARSAVAVLESVGAITVTKRCADHGGQTSNEYTLNWLVFDDEGAA